MSEMRKKLIIGTRGSTLALAQTRLVQDALSLLMPALSIEIRVITTKGDINQSPIPLDTIGKAWFTAEIESALMDREIDFAVHSLKDVPPQIADGSAVIPVLKREDPRDVLISKDHSIFTQLHPGAIIGTDSSRRRAQLLARRPDLMVKSIRGNIETRLRKLREEKYDAIVIAAAGLARLGLSGAVTQYFDAREFIPAPGQGILAAQIRLDDRELIELLERTQDSETVAAVKAERAFIETVESGCKSPIGAYAEIAGYLLTLHALIATVDGTDVRIDKEVGRTAEAHQIGVQLAKRMLGLHG